jgi:hypothetical protein
MIAIALKTATLLRDGISWLRSPDADHTDL